MDETDRDEELEQLVRERVRDLAEQERGNDAGDDGETDIEAVADDIAAAVREETDARGRDSLRERMNREMSRRQFLKLVGMGAGAVALSSAVGGFSLLTGGGQSNFQKLTGGGQSGFQKVSPTTIYDGFEDGDIGEYHGDTGQSWSVQSSTKYNGTYALKATNGNTYRIGSNSGLDNYPSRGDKFKCHVRYESQHSTIGFGWAGSGTRQRSNSDWSGYAVRWYGDNYSGCPTCADNFVLWRWDSGSKNKLAASNTNKQTSDWQRWEVDFQSTITVTVYDSNDSQILSVSASDSNYDSGGIAFSQGNSDDGSHAAYFDRYVSI